MQTFSAQLRYGFHYGGALQVATIKGAGRATHDIFAARKSKRKHVYIGAATGFARDDMKHDVEPGPVTVPNPRSRHQVMKALMHCDFKYRGVDLDQIGR